jgi:hypothetical protein
MDILISTDEYRDMFITYIYIRVGEEKTHGFTTG